MTFYNLRRALLSTSTLLFLLFIISTTTFASADQLPRGTVIERIVSESDASQSYALYLPSSYTLEIKWPVIYAFDPSGRGNVPVKLYREAAEKYGYIVAGSYNTQNGMQAASLQTAISTLIGDTRKRFSIDEKRVYTTGFSGGARIATRIASSCGGCIAGVIACGAGFPTDITPTSALDFAFYGTVGIDDYNYPELKRLQVKLNGLAISNHIATFEGEHQWASSQLLMNAVEWMELHAMRAGRRIRNDAFIDAQWKKGVEHARADEDAKKLYDAYLSYASLVADFKDLKDVAECESRMRHLKSVKEVTLALKDEGEQLKEQFDVTQQLIEFGRILLTEPTRRSSTLTELRVVIGNLRAKARASLDSSGRRVARRSLRQILAQTYEAAMFNYVPRKQYDVALVNLEVAEEVSPDNWKIPYELARVYTLSGEKKKALKALRRAVEKGLSDATIIENQKDFDAFRSEDEFKAIVRGIKQPGPSNL